MKKYYLLFIFLISVVAVSAQRLTADAPDNVAVGEQFRLTYTVNTQDVGNFRAGNIPSAFEVLMGPSTSSQSSFQMVNGHTSSSSSITYTYILSAVKNGTFTISPAHITVGGRTISSGSVRIRVSGSASGNAGGSSHRQSQQPAMRAAGSRIKGSDLFITVSANKRRVHEQEPILLTYKVFTLVDLTQLEGKMPDLKGFHTQEVKLPQQKSFSIESYHGRNYRTVTWSQYVMFPQQTGKLTIPSIDFEGIVVQQNRNVDPFEAFFNGGSGYTEVKKTIMAPSLTIQVDPLPPRPANFSGGVGHFSITSSINRKDCKTNDPVTLRVTVNGIGNMKLIKDPVVKFPKDFETYDAKITDNTKLTRNGVEGKKIYDFLAVPRHQGKYTIPDVEYTYYDTESNSYRTIKTQSVELNVAKGQGGNGSISDYSGQEDLKLLNQDIHFIKTGDAKLHVNNNYFFTSLYYKLSVIIPFVIFIILIVVFRNKAADAANIGKMRGKKANKVAVRRLKYAGNLLKAGKQTQFYDEVLKALWGYVGDKLNMPVEEFSRENISEKLTQADVDDDITKQFIAALDECEFVRYAPGNIKGNMDKVYSSALNVIMKMEDTIHIKHSKMSSGAVVLFFMLLLPLSSVQAMTKAEADSAYTHENYQKAISGYESILKHGESAKIYYNLGNAYYRTDNITRAVLNYERALLLSPGDDDIRFNLDMARSKTIDKITPASEMFFITWYRSLVNINSVDEWAVTAVICFVLFILFALLYLFNNKIVIRKIGFFSSWVMLLVFIFANVFAYQQKGQLVNRSGAIIISPSVSVKSTPAQNGTDLFLLHEGTKVTITDNSMRGWKEIKLADGKEGWVETYQMEVI